MVSILTRMLEAGHQKVNVDAESRRRIYAWIDSNAIYYPTFNMTRPHTTGGRDTFYSVDNNSRGPVKPYPWFTRFQSIYSNQCSTCHGEVIATGLANKQQWINLTRPENSRVLTAHLSKKAGGYGLTGARRKGQDVPVFESKKNATYLQLLSALREGKQELEKKPRIDMPGAVVIRQETDFGKTF
jgi:hypothetical protein